MATNVRDFADMDAEIQEGIRVIGSYVDLSGINFMAADSEQLNVTLQRGDKLTIMMVGKTGGGKSTLVNGLIGQKVAKEAEGVSTSGTTVAVIPYTTGVGKVNVTIYDSPGLQDGTKNEEKYLKEMKKKSCDIDLFIFAIRITDCKFVHRNPDAIAMAKITRSFGTAVWKKSLIVLTHANAVEAMNPSMHTMNPREKKAFFRKLVDDFTNVIHNNLVEDSGVPREIAQLVKVVPTGLESIKELVDGTLWFSNFWLECLLSIQSAKARAALIKLNATRFRSTTVTEMDFLQQLSDQPIIISKKSRDFTQVALTLGSAAGFGVLGAGIGAIGLIGGPIGLIGIPIGLYLGIVIGALLSAKMK